MCCFSHSRKADTTLILISFLSIVSKFLEYKSRKSINSAVISGKLRIELNINNIAGSNKSICSFSLIFKIKFVKIFF